MIFDSLIRNLSKAQWSLSARLTLFVFFSLMGLAVLLLSVFYFFIESHLKEIQQKRAHIYSHTIAVLASQALAQKDSEKLQQHLSRFVEQEEEFLRAMVVDRKFKIFALAQQKKDPQPLDRVPSTLKEAIRQQQRGSFRDNGNLCHYSPLFASSAQDKLVGGFCIALADDRWINLRKEMQIYFFMIFLGIVALSIGWAGWSSRRLSRPITQLASHVKLITEGDLSQNLDVRRHDEMGDLVSRVEQMRCSIKEYREGLERKVLERTRELRQALQKLQKKDANVEMELNLAAEIQKGILPDHHATWDGLEYYSSLVPMERVSGDFYEVIKKREFLNIIMSDVSGHGIPAALVTMAVKQTYQTQTIFKRTPVDFFQYINEEIYNRITTSDFLTAFNLYFTSSTDLIYASAGHHPAYLLRYHDNQIEELSTHGVLLGAFLHVNSQFEEKRIKIYPGDRIILFTDGILEQVNDKGEQFGEKRLQELVIRYSELNLPDLVNNIVSDVDTFRGQVPMQDDVTVLVVQLSPHYERAQEFVVLGRQAMEAEDYSESLRYGRRIYELISYLPEGIYLIGVSLYYLKRYEEALPYLNQYLRKFLDSVTTVGYMYFRTLLMTGQRNEAVAYGKRIIFEDMPISFYEELYDHSARILEEKEKPH